MKRLKSDVPRHGHASRGLEPTVELERTSWDVREKDIILICSYGLPRMVKDKEIRDVVRKSKEIDDAAKILVNRANKNGGVDNVTVVLVAAVHCRFRRKQSLLKHPNRMRKRGD
jgi:serine/threonine protein phosphatase PrpC